GHQAGRGGMGGGDPGGDLRVQGNHQPVLAEREAAAGYEDQPDRRETGGRCRPAEPAAVNPRALPIGPFDAIGLPEWESCPGCIARRRGEMTAAMRVSTSVRASVTYLSGDGPSVLWHCADVRPQTARPDSEDGNVSQTLPTIHLPKDTAMVEVGAPQPSADPEASLVRIYPAGVSGSLIPLCAERNTIGRDAACDVELMDDFISREHAIITQR